MKRLTAQQVKDLREVVQSSQSHLTQKFLDARRRRPIDLKEVAFYAELIQRNNGLLNALPVQGGVELEDDLSDEQRDEEDD